MAVKLLDPSLIEGVKSNRITAEEAKVVIDKTALELYGLIKDEKKAVAIAAPQVGILKRYFVLKNVSGKGYQVVFNPVYTKDGSLIRSKESCLSYGLDDFSVVKRFKSIRLKHDVLVDGKLETKIEYIKYPLSVIVQHETDHLDGRTIFFR